MKSRITELSKKSYQENIEGEFDHVVMFVPSEAMAAATFSIDPDLMDYAMSKSVLVATPVTMLGLLRTVALTGNNMHLLRGRRKSTMYQGIVQRITTMIDHFQKVGGHLSKAAKAYDATMNSYEGRVLPQGRRLEELKVSETLQATLPEPKDIDHPKE